MVSTIEQLSAFNPLPGKSPGEERYRDFVPNARTTHDTNPFQAQYRILQILQRRLKLSAFRFIRRWLPLQSLAVGWTCPEALELPQVLKLLLNIDRKFHPSKFVKKIGPLQGLRDSVARIRHAAFHRLPQDRDTLLQMNHDAAEFCLCIGKAPDVESLCRLFWFLQKTPPNSSVVPMPTGQTQSQQIHRSTPPSRKCRNNRPIGFLDGVARLIGCVEMDLVAEVERFLQIEFS